MIEVLRSGPLAIAQDLGRRGYLELGVGRSGAADRSAHLLANRLVGNRSTAATIEITFGGLVFQLRRAATIALTGALCAGPPAWNSALSLPSGTVVRLGPPAAGVRSYLAIRGGFAVPMVMGSRSTDTLSGLGPPALSASQLLPIGTDIVGQPSDEAIIRGREDLPLRVVLGPRDGWFTKQARERLFDAEWAVLPASNRIGVRLDGTPLTRSNHGELATEATLPGAIQVPPDGRPIVLGPDAPVTGGYPVIGVLATADLARLGQLRPGRTVRFTPVRMPR